MKNAIKNIYFPKHQKTYLSTKKDPDPDPDPYFQNRIRGQDPQHCLVLQINCVHLIIPPFWMFCVKFVNTAGRRCVETLVQLKETTLLNTLYYPFLEGGGIQCMCEISGQLDDDILTVQNMFGKS